MVVLLKNPLFMGAHMPAHYHRNAVGDGLSLYLNGGSQDLFPGMLDS